ncbi:SDR family oxidoreductase [Nibrella viscosa]|uniref:SDR family oxidoreductase n=1 Tax=Nibrella viscosa TaxID=1084524 RepID=A0ABP8KFD9_9BACT
MDLTGNTMLITGATSGIGLALTTRFSELGNTVIAVGRNPTQLAELTRRSDRIHPVQADLASAQDIERLVMLVEQQYPSLNVLINNAGVQYTYSFAESSEHLSRITHELTVNLTAPLHLISLLLPLLLTQPKAAVVNVSSGLGLVPKRSAPVYCATKAGLHIFSKALGYQMSGTSVRVMEVIPPLVDTPMTAGRGRSKISPEQLVEEFLRQFARDRSEINIGKVGLLRLLQRISPALADRLLRDG